MSQTINKPVTRSKKKQLCFTIGSKIKILDSANKNLININGIIVDETKYALIIQTKSKKIKVIKSALKKITINDEIFDFDDFFIGKSLMQYFTKTIYDKIKKLG